MSSATVAENQSLQLYLEATGRNGGTHSTNVSFSPVLGFRLPINIPIQPTTGSTKSRAKIGTTIQDMNQCEDLLW
jgi:hypothetical protein